jgi:hypothetical protein
VQAGRKSTFHIIERAGTALDRHNYLKEFFSDFSHTRKQMLGQLAAAHLIMLQTCKCDQFQLVARAVNALT